MKRQGIQWPNEHGRTTREKIAFCEFGEAYAEPLIRMGASLFGYGPKVSVVIDGRVVQLGGPTWDKILDTLEADQEGAAK